jgi:hypothetical protein
MESFRSAFRDELDARTLAGVTGVFVVFHLLADLSTLAVVGAPAALVAVAALTAYCVSRGHPETVASVVICASGALVLGSVALTTTSWLPGALAAIAAWVCLDSLYDLRRGVDRSDGPDDDISEDEYYLASAHGWTAISELREADRPLSRSELQDRTGLPDEDFERVLETVGESGPIERVGTGYAIDEREMGTAAAVRSVARGTVSRLIRPFRLLRSTVPR